MRQIRASRQGPGFVQPELGAAELHFDADLLRRLITEVESFENLAIPRADVAERSPHPVQLLPPDRARFRVLIEGRARLDALHRDEPPALEGRVANVRHCPAARHGPDETHQAFGLPEPAILNGFEHDDHDFVQPVIHRLYPHASRQTGSNPVRQDRVQLLHSGFVSAADFLHDFGPMRRQ